ncbi:MAG: glycosyltransferase [Candidatus Hodarchaeota archaeon]
MRIGYVLTDFPVLTETFIRREIQALCQAGHRVFVYTNRQHWNPFVPQQSEPTLVIREIPFLSKPAALVRAAQDDGVEHLHASLMIAAHRAAHRAARSLQTLFTLTAYSGHDIFTADDPDLYRTISADPLCEAIIVEDPFMRDWLVDRLGADLHKIVIIANSFDLELYRLRKPHRSRDQVVILAVGRFVEKKGLIYLIHAFNKVCTGRNNVELRLVGEGPEGLNLRRAADQNAKIKFLGTVSESQTRQLYADADIFCLPCIRTAHGDADGVPTTILEAMAFKLPVISSDLLSIPYYVRDCREGLLAPPRDVTALTAALERLCADKKLREDLGQAGRARVRELCDLKSNVQRLQSILLEGRRALWHAKLSALEEQRATYTVERENYYTECRKRAIAYFQPSGGLLDIGCHHGKFRLHLGLDVKYFGCDVVIDGEVRGAFPFVAAAAEALPFRSSAFDSALLYAVLPHVFDIDAVLAEAARVLKPGGHLYLQECFDDANPIHLNHLTDAGLHDRVAEHFNVLDSRPASDHLMLMIAEKPVTIQVVEKSPLVSVAITTYNREKLTRRCIDSVLRQTYRPVEIVVVDDGSTDGTREMLEEYGSAIHVAYNERNRGRVITKNRALTMTSQVARYVALLDSDDYYHPRFVERCLHLLEQSPEIGLVYTDDIVVDDNGRELRRQPAVEPWSIERWLRTRNLRGDTWLARRDLVMNTALHDQSLELDEDYDLFYQLLEITSFAHLSEFLVYINQNTEQRARDKMELAKCHAANLVKYGYSPEYAYLRARYNPEWVPAIEEGIALGKRLREQRKKKASNMGHKEGRV